LRGIAIIMSSWTGEVVAMAKAPGFDSNHWKQACLLGRKEASIC